MVVCTTWPLSVINNTSILNYIRPAQAITLSLDELDPYYYRYIHISIVHRINLFHQMLFQFGSKLYRYHEFYT